MIKLEEKWILGKKKALFFLIVVLLILSTASVATAAPDVDFNGDPLTGNAPLAVHFVGISNETVLWSWNFGDGSSSNVNPTDHTYAIAGNLNVSYFVNLTVTSVNGTTSENKTNYIKVLPPVTVASFTASPSSGRVPLTVNFTDSSTYGPTSWSWQFGDGHTNTTSAQPTNTYLGIGRYTVNLTATNPGGSSSKSGVITVNPRADFYSPNATGVEGRATYFFDTSSVGTTTTDPLVSWLWNFGDGKTSTDQNPVHQYPPGKFTVNLTVTSQSGLTDTISKTDYIKTDSGNLYLLRTGINGNTYFRADKYGVAPGDQIQFVAYSTRTVIKPLFRKDSSTNYTWEFIGAYDPTHYIKRGPFANPDLKQTFTDADIYTVRLTVNDSRDTFTVTKPRLIVVR